MKISSHTVVRLSGDGDKKWNSDVIHDIVHFVYWGKLHVTGHCGRGLCCRCGCGMGRGGAHVSKISPLLPSVDLNAADTGVQLKTTVVSAADRSKPGSAETKREGQCQC